MTDLPDDKISSSGPSIVQEREASFPLRPEEKVTVVEVGRIAKTEAEEEGHLKRLEKELELQKPVTDDWGQILVTSPTAQQPKIVLPMDRTTYLNPKNWHKPVTSALRWLLTWAQRIVKMHPKEVVFEEN